MSAPVSNLDRIREAHLLGLSAPTVGARFGVSVAAIRERAAREGWTEAAMGDTPSPWWSGTARRRPRPGGAGRGGAAAFPEALPAAHACLAAEYADATAGPAQPSLSA